MAVAVAFSGGVDSTLLAKVCADLAKQVTLVTVGFPGSHDVEFSQKIAQLMGMETQQKIVEICSSGFAADLAHVRRVVPECSNTSHIENCVAYLYIARAARAAGLSTVLSANGCDELFCGYNGYRAAFEEGGEPAIMTLMEAKIANELVLVQEMARIAGEYGVRVAQPFLSPGFIEFAKAIPVDQKIKGADDLVRKHVLRQAAMLVGVPAESANKPKKALQYGSLIHKNFKLEQRRQREAENRKKEI